MTAKKNANRPYSIGAEVGYTKFGQGAVVVYEGDGDDVRIQIDFGRQGMKCLMLHLAKLEWMIVDQFLKRGLNHVCSVSFFTTFGDIQGGVCCLGRVGAHR
jgi:hypothetical protein